MLAARLLEQALLRLGRADTVVGRRLAPGLARLHGRRLYRLLGYVRLGDYLTERLGMSLRRCQSILRLERALASLPRMARALEAGEVSVSRLEIAAGAATAETEAAWLERSEHMPLTVLREMARHEKEVSAASSSSAAAGAPPAAAAGPPAAAGAPPDLPFEQDEPGRLVSFAAPASVLAIWHCTLDLVRRVAGQQEPAWRCAEYLAAEFLSGIPDASDDRPTVVPVHPQTDACRPGPDVSRGAPDPSAFAERPAAPAPTPRDTSGAAAWMEATAAVRQALASIGASADPETILSGHATSGGRAGTGAERSDRQPGAAHVDTSEIDAWELDVRLRGLVRVRQSLAWRQGHLLATFAALGLHRDLGFAGFEDWVEDRLAMSARRARYLVSLARRLRDLPLLADAYRRGLVSWCQARLLVRVVRPATQSRWIRYARRVTVRRLEDVVVECMVDTSQTVDPLPPADSVPGPTDEALSDAGRHTSAPPVVPGAVQMTGYERLPWRRISFWCPLPVASLWESALRSCRAAAGHHLEDWECFLLLVRSLRETWENQEDPHWRRRYRIFERDGWRCKAPGCSSRSGLNEHHVIFRSQQGEDDAENLVTLCIGHHQEGVHDRHIRCFGKAPDGLWWDLGVRPGGEPLARYFGDRMVRGRPFVSIASSPRPVGAAAGLA